MSRRGDNAPVSQTCPKIDDVISSMKELYLSSEPMSKWEMNQLEKTMESIRKDNSDLRDWGNQMYNELYEMEKDRDYYQKLAERYESEVEDLKIEVNKLENELENIEK